MTGAGGGEGTAGTHRERNAGSGPATSRLFEVFAMRQGLSGVRTAADLAAGIPVGVSRLPSRGRAG